MDKDNILQTIRRNKRKEISLSQPIESLEEKNVTDLKNRFKEVLIQIGADYFEVSEPKKFDEFIEKHYLDAIDFRNKETWKQYPPDCSKEKLVDLKTVILEGLFGVAENGAIWIDNSNFPNRLVPFICEQLIICLNSEQILKDMNEAYSKLTYHNLGFGVFISGPSKTADIEQNLVYGAHGAKKMLVGLLSNLDYIS